MVTRSPEGCDGDISETWQKLDASRVALTKSAQYAALKPSTALESGNRYERVQVVRGMQACAYTNSVHIQRRWLVGPPQITQVDPSVMKLK